MGKVFSKEQQMDIAATRTLPRVARPTFAIFLIFSNVIETNVSLSAPYQAREANQTLVTRYRAIEQLYNISKLELAYTLFPFTLHFSLKVTIISLCVCSRRGCFFCAAELVVLSFVNTAARQTMQAPFTLIAKQRLSHLPVGALIQTR